MRVKSDKKVVNSLLVTLEFFATAKLASKRTLIRIIMAKFKMGDPSFGPILARFIKILLHNNIDFRN
jgi:hypothetical protein